MVALTLTPASPSSLQASPSVVTRSLYPSSSVYPSATTFPGASSNLAPAAPTTLILTGA